MRVGKPLSHRVWFRILLVACFMIPAVVEVPAPPEKTPEVIAAVLQNPFSVQVTSLLPLAKLLLLAAAVLPFLGVRWAGRLLLSYYAAVLVVVGVMQNMANTAEFGFAWLVGNTVVQFVVATWCVVDVVHQRSTLERRHLRPGRLWLLIPMALAFLMPYEVVDDRIIASVATVLWNDAGLTYCMITPVVIGVMLIFRGGVDARTLAVTSFVGFGFGLLNVVVWFVVNPADWWMGVLHVPLLVIAGLGLWDARLVDIEPNQVGISTGSVCSD